MAKWKIFLKNVLPVPLLNLLRVIRNPISHQSDLSACLSFVLNRDLNTPLRTRLKILNQLYVIHFAVDSPHTQQEILSYVHTILSLPRDSKGVVVEAGCCKGSSTAKFSLAADIACRPLVVFDSFQGIPDNDEPKQTTIFGETASLKKDIIVGV